MSIVRENRSITRVYAYRDNYNETLLGATKTVNADTRTVLLNTSLQNYVRKDMTKRDWRRLIAEHKNATTYLEGVKYSCDVGWGQAYLRVRKKALVSGKVQINTYINSGMIVGCDNPGTPAGISYTEADNMAKTRFVQRARAAQTDFQGLTHLAESREAIRMLRNSTQSMADQTRRYLDDVKRLALGYKRPKRGKKRKLPPDPKRDIERSGIADRYLGYVYGVSPLVGTVKDAAEALAERSLDRISGHKYIMASGNSRITSSYKKGTVLIANAFLYHPVWTDADVATVVYRGMVKASQDTIQEVNRNLGLDLSSFAPTVWEVIPYSFVADYFTNISDMVDAASFPRATLDWVAKTIILEKERKLEVEMTWQYNPDPNVNSEITKSWSKPSCVWRNSSVNRSNYGGSLVPDFRISLDELSFKKGLNLTALARQNRGVLRLLNHLFVSK